MELPIVLKHRSQMRPCHFVPPQFVATLGMSSLAPPVLAAKGGTYGATTPARAQTPP